MLGLILAIVMLALGWVFLLRPQMQRQREHVAMVEALVVGDRVITAGGIHGTLTEVGDDTMRIRVADDVELTIARVAVRERLSTHASESSAPADADDALHDPEEDTP